MFRYSSVQILTIELETASVFCINGFVSFLGLKNPRVSRAYQARSGTFSLPLQVLLIHIRKIKQSASQHNVATAASHEGIPLMDNAH